MHYFVKFIPEHAYQFLLTSVHIWQKQSKKLACFWDAIYCIVQVWILGLQWNRGRVGLIDCEDYDDENRELTCTEREQCEECCDNDLYVDSKHRLKLYCQAVTKTTRHVIPAMRPNSHIPSKHNFVIRITPCITLKKEQYDNQTN